MTHVAELPRMRQRYNDDVVPKLLEEFKYHNVMQVPRLERIAVNIGLGEAIADAGALDRAVEDITAITGQKPLTVRAKKSIANFKLREGMPIGVSASLRGNRMWEFFDRMLTAALPSIRDFQGLSPDAFDGRGNYSVGFKEQLIFPEIDFDQIDKVRGLQVTLVTTATNDEEARRMLELFGWPFARN